MKALKGRGVSGQGMTEYILLVFLIALIAYFGVKMYGGKIKKGYNVGSQMIQNVAK